MESIRLKDTNWFLYMVTKRSDRLNLSPEEWGVGFCSLGPGINDAPYGKLLVAPGYYVSRYFKQVKNLKSITPGQLKQCVLLFYYGEKKCTYY
jgi:hypothetical protein